MERENIIMYLIFLGIHFIMKNENQNFSWKRTRSDIDGLNQISVVYVIYIGIHHYVLKVKK